MVCPLARGATLLGCPNPRAPFDSRRIAFTPPTPGSVLVGAGSSSRLGITHNNSLITNESGLLNSDSFGSLI